MPTFETYVEVPIYVEFDWTEDGPEITNIQLRTDNGRVIRKAATDKELPAVDLHEWLNDREMKIIEQNVIEDASKE